MFLIPRVPPLIGINAPYGLGCHRVLIHVLSLVAAAAEQTEHTAGRQNQCCEGASSAHHNPAT